MGVSACGGGLLSPFPPISPTTHPPHPPQVREPWLVTGKFQTKKVERKRETQSLAGQS